MKNLLLFPMQGIQLIWNNVEQTLFSIIQKASNNF